MTWTREALIDRFDAVRSATSALLEPLTPEDALVQSMPDVSPTKWHAAHTTWFFETFVLEAHEPGYTAAHPEYRVLFNSYYNGVGEQFPRAHRGDRIRRFLGLETNPDPGCGGGFVLHRHWHSHRRGRCGHLG